MPPPVVLSGSQAWLRSGHHHIWAAVQCNSNGLCHTHRFLMSFFSELSWWSFQVGIWLLSCAVIKKAVRILMSHRY